MNLPRTAEGAACLRAVEACLTGGGMGAPSVDMGGATALARAARVPSEIAAVLLVAAADGIRAGLADRKDIDP